MNKVIVTGLALGGVLADAEDQADVEQSACGICNYDFGWLFNHPSTLLWVDRIVVTPQIREVIGSGLFPLDEAIAKSIKLAFDIIEDQGLIEVRDQQEVITPEVYEAICMQVDRDRELLPIKFSNNVWIPEDIDMPGEILIDGSSYCSTHARSIYVGLVLARAWEANCLFNDSALKYCKFRFAESGFPREGSREQVIAFHQILQAYLPEPNPFPLYIFEKRCENCIHVEKCKDTFLHELEKNLKDFLKWRDYDELHQLREVLVDIAKHKETSEQIQDASDIILDFEAVERKLHKRLHSTFPKVRRWTNLVTILSVPLAVAGISSGLSLLTIPGVTLAGASQIANKSMDLLSSRYRWVGFLNKQV